MKFISLAAHNNELILVKDMDTFTAHFCYAKKQKQGAIAVVAPAIETTDDAVIPVTRMSEEIILPDEDDL